MTNAEILIIVFTGVIAITGILGALIFNNQLSVMQGQLDEMREQRRPWINCTVDITPLQVGAQVQARVQYTNVGQSPAFKVRNMVMATGVERGNPDPAPMVSFPADQIDKITSSGLLLPGSPMFAWPKLVNGAKITQTDLDTIKNGGVVLWLVGRIEYVDGEGQPHFTMFSGFYDPSIGAFTYSIEGNDAR